MFQVDNKVPVERLEKEQITRKKEIFSKRLSASSMLEEKCPDRRFSKVNLSFLPPGIEQPKLVLDSRSSSFYLDKRLNDSSQNSLFSYLSHQEDITKVINSFLAT